MYKNDCKANKYVATVLKMAVRNILNATADCSENYWIDDISISAGTEDNYQYYPCENKTLKGGWQFKYDDTWNPYFTGDIYRKLRFEGEAPASGTPIYFINATDAYGDIKNGKYYKLVDNNACLSFLGPDCILFYTPAMLKSAFMGYADYYVPHTTEFGYNKGRRWEKKAILNLSMAYIIPCSPPIDIFEK